MTLPPIATNYQLPPINQIPGYSVPGQPGPNPMQQLHGFWQDPGTGRGINVQNAGDAIYRAPQGNPLYYGQTAAYTGPMGATDGEPPVNTPLPPVHDVASQGMTIGDLINIRYGSGQGFDDWMGVLPMLRGGHDRLPDFARGLDLSAAYDPQNPQQAQVFDWLASQLQGRQGGENAGGGMGGAP